MKEYLKPIFISIGAFVSMTISLVINAAMLGAFILVGYQIYMGFYILVTKGMRVDDKDVDAIYTFDMSVASFFIFWVIFIIALVTTSSTSFKDDVGGIMTFIIFFIILFIIGGAIGNRVSKKTRAERITLFRSREEEKNRIINNKIAELENAIYEARAKIDSLQSLLDNKRVKSFLLLINNIDQNNSHANNYAEKMNNAQLSVTEGYEKIDEYEQKILIWRDKKTNSTYEEVIKLSGDDAIPLERMVYDKETTIKEKDEERDYSRIVGIITLLIVVALLFYVFSKA